VRAKALPFQESVQSFQVVPTVRYTNPLLLHRSEIHLLALKLKELAYIHAEGFAGGELKHGPIALIDQGTPVIAILPAGHEHALDEKMLSNIQEVKARGARVIVIAEEGAHVEGAEHIIRIPVVPALFQPVLATVPLQVFAYEMAVARGNDVDQPRNLAKSVTVE
jgi:glucosamine--fructose-6-phosphate aminotransferase (isomerizing)